MTITSHEEAPQVLAGLLARFPRGRAVTISISDEVMAGNESRHLPDGFMERLQVARSRLPMAPWQTTEEALRAIREGEEE